MKDRQVIELYYRLKIIETIDFKSPPPIEGETASFYYFLNNEKLTIKLKQHCSSVEEGQNLVDYFLRSWELDDAIRNGRRRFEFELYDAKIIDPKNPNTTIVYSQGVSLRIGGSGKVKFIYPCYPDPPVFFRITPDVIDLWDRYERYLNNNEPLQSMAYSCLTFIEKCAVNRKNAAKYYKIDYKVFDIIGNFTGETRGDKKTVRKFKRDVSPRPLSPIENEWIRAALMAIIRRVGEINIAS